MGRLVDIDALSHEMYHLAFETDSNLQKWDGGCWIRYKMFERCRDNAPTIDAVSVVRCDACKNWDLDWSSTRDPDLHYCWMIDLFTDGKFYCKDGDRRTHYGN